MEAEIINKIAQSGIVTLDLEDYYPIGERVIFDIAQQLFMGIILKEKDFRTFLKEHNWEQYQDKHVAIICTEPDAIIQTWAYMLLSAKLQPFAKSVFVGSVLEMENQLFLEQLKNIDLAVFKGVKVVLKGCSKLDVPAAAYAWLTGQLIGIASSVMFGEPCSTVPVYKAKIQ